VFRGTFYLRLGLLFVQVQAFDKVSGCGTMHHETLLVTKTKVKTMANLFTLLTVLKAVPLGLFHYNLVKYLDNIFFVYNFHPDSFFGNPFF